MFHRLWAGIFLNENLPYISEFLIVKRIIPDAMFME